MALPPPLAAAMVASGVVAVASILLFYTAYFRGSSRELRRARLFLKYGRFEKSFVVVAFMAIAATVMALAALAVAPDAVSDIPDIPLLLTIQVPLCLGYIYSYYVGRGKEPPLLALWRKRKMGL